MTSNAQLTDAHRRASVGRKEHTRHKKGDKTFTLIGIQEERLFRVDTSDPENPQPRGEQVGTALAECTTITVGEEDAPEDLSVLCSRMFVLDGRGEIAAAESYTFADPLSDTDPITGGTDTFRDVGGEVSFDVQEIEGTDLFNSIYTFRLLRLDDGRR